MSGGRDWTRKEEQEAINLCRNNIPYRVIAKRLNRSYCAVSQKLCKLKRENGGFDLQKYAPRRKAGELSKRVKELWRPGIADSWLAGVLDVHFSLISRTRRKLGLPRGASKRLPGIIPWLRKIDLIKDRDATLKICLRLWEYSVPTIASLLCQAKGIEVGRGLYSKLRNRLQSRRDQYNLPRMLDRDGKQDDRHLTIDGDSRHGNECDSLQGRESQPRLYRIYGESGGYPEY